MDRSTDTLLARFEAEYLEVHSITTERRVTQLRLLRRLADGLDHPLTELTPQDINIFIGAALRDGLHPNTMRTRMGMIRSFVTWASAADLIEPLRSIQLKSVGNPRGSSGRSRPRPYKMAEVAEFKRLLAEKYPVLPQYGPGSRLLPFYIRGRTHTMRRHLWRHARRLQFEAQVALALEQGLRRVEIHRLTIPAMHYDNDQVVVLTAKQGPGTQVTRTVPYTAHARECVQEWLDFRWLLTTDHQAPWLSLTPTNSRDAQLTAQSFTTFSKSLFKAFGGEWEWHRFRHTAATEWLRAGVPLDKVSRFMGHSSLEQTRAYTEVLDSDVEAAFGAAEASFAKRLGHAA